MLKDTRFALRMFARNPGMTALATLALALGIGGSTLIFSVVNAVLLRPLPVSDPDRLVWIWANSPRLGFHLVTNKGLIFSLGQIAQKDQ